VIAIVVEDTLANVPLAIIEIAAGNRNSKWRTRRTTVIGDCARGDELVSDLMDNRSLQERESRYLICMSSR